MFTVEPQEFSRALKIMMTARARLSSRPILTGALLNAAPGRLEISATDLECGARYTIDGAGIQGNESFSAIVDPAPIIKAIGKARAPIGLEIGENGYTLTIRNNGSSILLTSDKVEDFPSLPKAPAGGARLPWTDFQALIGRVEHAGARESTRYALNAIYLKAAGGRLEAAATDGRRLAIETIDIEAGADFAALLPLSAVRLIKKAKLPKETIVEITATGSAAIIAGEAEETENTETETDTIGRPGIFITAGPLVLSALKVEGHFPPVHDVIPDAPALRFTIPAAPFVAALDQAKALLKDSEITSMRLYFSGGAVSVLANNNEGQRAEAKIQTADMVDTRPARVIEPDPAEFAKNGVFEEHWPCGQCVDEPFDIRFNPAFLLEAIKAGGAENVTLAMDRPDTPAILYGAGEYRDIIMPIHIV